MSFHIITVNNLKNYFHSFVFFFLMAKKRSNGKVWVLVPERAN